MHSHGQNTEIVTAEKTLVNLTPVLHRATYSMQSGRMSPTSIKSSLP